MIKFKKFSITKHKHAKSLSLHSRCSIWGFCLGHVVVFLSHSRSRRFLKRRPYCVCVLNPIQIHFHPNWLVNNKNPGEQVWGRICRKKKVWLVMCSSLYLVFNSTKNKKRFHYSHNPHPHTFCFTPHSVMILVNFDMLKEFALWKGIKKKNYKCSE